MMDVFKNVTWFVDKVMMTLGYLVILTWMSQYKLTIVTLVIFVGLHAIPWIYDKQQIKKEQGKNVQQGITREEIAMLVKQGITSEEVARLIKEELSNVMVKEVE